MSTRFVGFRKSHRHLNLQSGSARLKARFVACLLASVGVVPAVAQSSVPQDNTWGTNGVVRAIARTTATIYLGGHFSRIGPVTGSGVPIDIATSQPVPSFPKVIGPILVCVGDGGGGWYVGGRFTQVGTFKRNRLAHIKPDGTVDASWDPNPDGPYSHVSALAVSGPTVYVGGSFKSIGGQARSGIAALEGSTGNATEWNPTAIGSIAALAVAGSTIYAGGEFAMIGGQARKGLAALEASTGKATEWNPNPDQRVEALVVSGSIIYVGGYFSAIGALSLIHI